MSDDDELIKHMTSLIAAGLDRIEVLTAEAAKMLSEADYKYNRKTNDMIERHAEQVKALTAERDHAWEMVAKADTQVGQALADRLQATAERDRLREALTDALDAWDTHNKHGDPMQGWWVHDAQAALKGETL